MKGSNTQLEKPFFPNLNGLRFFAAIAVILFHSVTLEREIWGDFYHSIPFQKFANLALKGHFGIIFFFVLSGFLITYLLLWETKNKGRINIFNYLIRRFLRVWPLYFLIVLFGFLISPHLPYGIETKHEFWRYLFFLSNIDEILIGPIDPINFLSATWTVSVEEQFYLAWGILIGVFQFSKKRTYYFFFFSVILLALLFRYLHLDEPRTLYFHTFSVMSDLAIGGIIGLLAYEGRIIPFFKKMKRWQLLVFYFFSLLFLVYEGHYLNGFFFMFERVIPGFIFAFIILEQIYAERSFFKADAIPFFAYSGKITYGFYMFHCISIYYWSIFFKNMGLTGGIGGYLLFFAVVFATTYLLAHLSFKYYETPILKLKRFFR